MHKKVGRGGGSNRGKKRVDQGKDLSPEGLVFLEKI